MTNKAPPIIIVSSYTTNLSSWLERPCMIIQWTIVRLIIEVS